jgi:8-oxo-dGTP pyrophosphatase MutT (NUDIX family)
MGQIVAAGAVLWRWRHSGEVEIALVHRPRYGDWSLPKGKLDPGESIWAAAVREVREETGFEATLGRSLGQAQYRVDTPAAATKTVSYFAARAGNGEFRPSKEVDELRWLPPEQALKLLSYQDDREIVRSFTTLPPDTAALLLVRHAKAGSRRDWDGTDELRPLSARGWKQVAALCPLLLLFGANRVHSAPLTRCGQTVAGLADDLGVPLVEEPLLSEAGYEPDREAGVARLREIAAEGGTPVVCSQGGVIPDAVARLAGESGLMVDPVPSKKGSIWVLSFRRGGHLELVAADYIFAP